MVDSAQGAAHAGQDVATRFLEQARSPGLDIDGSPFEIAQDYAYALRHLAEWLSRTTEADRGAPRQNFGEILQVIHLSDSLEWRVSAFVAKDNTLHRWTSAPKIDNDWLSRELHSWAVLGDTMASSAPMMLHVVETGNVRHGHLYGPWSRVYRHPSIAKFQFQKSDGSRLEESWKICWAQDLHIEPSQWIDWMERDQVQGIQHLPIKVPSEVERNRWIQQLEDFVPRLLTRRDPLTVLPNLSACDGLTPCAFQLACFPPIGPEQAGGFVRIENHTLP